jgi:hypothetical protein
MSIIWAPPLEFSMNRDRATGIIYSAGKVFLQAYFGLCLPLMLRRWG